MSFDAKTPDLKGDFLLRNLVVKEVGGSLDVEVEKDGDVKVLSKEEKKAGTKAERKA